ncbi:MAG: hypothetical protein IPK19_34775 [Chloroflexi bacterium]|nr:hypothetical protein [Chloroflexota bacterium]
MIAPIPTSLDPLLEALTLPRTDTYTLTVSSVADTSGSYTLEVTPGLAQTSIVGFGEDGWAAEPEGATVNATPDRVILTLEGAQLTGFASGEGLPEVGDAFVQVDVIAVSSPPSAWSAGLTLRGTGASRYHYTINDDGLWRFSEVSAEGERVIRDWTPHPAIVAGRTPFSLGVLAVGTGFDFFYDSAYIGSVDDEALLEAGQVGLAAAAPSALATTNIITYANLIITIPDSESDAQELPDSVFVSADGRATVTALRRQLPIGTNGEMTLNVPESSVQYNRAGINLLGIGRGARFRNFALGVTTSLSADNSGFAGCGIAFRVVDDTHYTMAFFSQEGEFGISRRDGDTFAPGLAGVLSNPDATRRHLLIVASDTRLVFYVDGQLAGTQEDEPVDGTLSIAAVNFEPNSTTCLYEDLWIWSWE